MEGQSITGKPDVYRAMAASGNKFRIVAVTYPSASPATARKIAETHPAPMGYLAPALNAFEIKNNVFLRKLFDVINRQ